MPLTAVDWAAILGYFAVAMGVGLYFRRRVGRSMTEYFASGRTLPWWAAGTSMVATTFGADTPLAVQGLVADYGLAGNWPVCSLGASFGEWARALREIVSGRSEQEQAQLLAGNAERLYGLD